MICVTKDPCRINYNINIRKSFVTLQGSVSCEKYKKSFTENAIFSITILLYSSPNIAPVFMGVRLRPGSVLHLHSQSPKNVSPRKLRAIKKRAKIPNAYAQSSRWKILIFATERTKRTGSYVPHPRYNYDFYGRGYNFFFLSILLPRFIPFLEKLLGI